MFPGEQQPIVDRELFEAVQAKLKAGAVVRTARRSQSPAFLMGLLHDDRGNRMSPSHANKKGVRYRYYVSQAVLQNRKTEAGAVVRVAVSEIEDLVVAAIRHHLGLDKPPADLDHSPSSAPAELSDRDLVALHVERIVLRARHVDVSVRAGASGCQQPEDGDGEPNHENLEPIILHLPRTPTNAVVRKGVDRITSTRASLDPAPVEALLTAIAKARAWMNDLAEGRAESFEEIARREAKVERHIRNLAVLAFASPHLIEAIANGRAPSELTVTALARNLPISWVEQQKQFIVG